MKATRRGFLAAIGIGTAVAHAAPVAPVHDAADLKYLPATGANCERVVLLDDADGREKEIALHGVTGTHVGAGYLTLEGDWRLGGPGLESSFTRRTFRRFVIIPASDFAPDLVFEGVPLSWNTAASHDGVVSNTIKLFLSKPPTQITLAEYF